MKKMIRTALLLPLLVLILSACSTSKEPPSPLIVIDTSPTALTTLRTYPALSGEMRIHLSFSKDIDPDAVNIYENESPAQLILKFKSVKNHVSKIPKKTNLGLIKNIQLAELGSNAQVKIDLRDHVVYSTNITGKDITLTLKKKTTDINDLNAHHESPQTIKSKYQVQDIEFHKGSNGNGEVILTLSNQSVTIDMNQKKHRLTMTLPNTSLSKTVVTSRNLVDQGTPIKFIKASEKNNTTTIQVTTKAEFKYVINRFYNKAIVNIQPISLSGLAELSKKQANYSGKPLSLKFQNIKVRSLLQIIAEFTGINMVISQSVQGEMSLHLKNIPWDQALDMILKSQGLSKRRIGDMVLIAPSEEITARELQELQAKQQVKSLAPLYSEIIHLHYANGKDIAQLLKDKTNSLLSTRGQVNVDDRTNTLWVRDIASNLSEVRNLIKRLDIPVRQVLIEARIVSVDSNFEKEMGARFGITRPKRLSGTLKGASELQNGTAVESVPFADRLNFDFSAKNVGQMNGAASIGLALFKIGNNTLLDLELSALESEGTANIISSPRLITSNRQAATIETGEEIPYQEATSSGATNIAFKKAVLSLKITPQITPNDKIILHLIVSEDKRGKTVLIGGPPAIDTNSIQTHVLLNDNETIVLGGVYKQTVTNVIERVPFFGRLPYIGKLFQHKQETKERRELLVFITPSIIRSADVAQ